jgi:Fe-S-cluster containining protein
MIHKNTSRIIVEELGKDCKKCGHCCSYGSGIVLETEVPKIAVYLNKSVDDFKKDYLDEIEFFSKKHTRLKQIKSDKKNSKIPHGKCIFLTSINECAIHEVKPLYCKIGHCGPLGDDAIQWFHLNHSVDKYNPNSIREWNIYASQKSVISGGKPIEIVGDADVLKKMLEYEILK